MAALLAGARVEFTWLPASEISPCSPASRLHLAAEHRGIPHCHLIGSHLATIDSNDTRCVSRIRNVGLHLRVRKAEYAQVDDVEWLGPVFLISVVRTDDRITVWAAAV